MESIREIFDDAENRLKSVEIHRPLTECDVGLLMASDADLNETEFSKSADEYIRFVTRDNIQLLINKIWELPTERQDGEVVVKLTRAAFKLPRAKRVPKPRAPTRWEEYAKLKGIQKKKKSKLNWDEQLKKWVPLYGMKRARAQREKDWVLEVPANADPYEDQFAKRADAKTERVAKNELQRLRNVAKARKVKIPRTGILEPSVATAKELQAAVTVSRSSTASLGRFQNRLPGEKEARGVSHIVPGSRKRKAPPPATGTQEIARSLAIAEGILKKRPRFNIEKAVDRQINTENIERAEEKRSVKPKAGRSGKKRKGGDKTQRGTGSGKKSKGGKGRKRR